MTEVAKKYVKLSIVGANSVRPFLFSRGFFSFYLHNVNIITNLKSRQLNFIMIKSKKVMKMFITKEKINDFKKGNKQEWLLTNGIGGFAAGTVLGSNSRRYHGLLFAAFNPPADRKLIVSNIHEILSVDNENIKLANFECDNGYYELNVDNLVGFQNNFMPTWNYKINDINLIKQIWMVEGKNTTVVKYKIKTGNRGVKLSLLPLVNYRDYHSERVDFSGFYQYSDSNKLTIKIDSNANRNLNVICNEGYKFNENINLFYNMFYQKESERGLNSVENHYMPGSFDIELNPNETKIVNIIFTTEEDLTIDLNLEYEKMLSRPAELINKAGFNNKIANELVKAADKFIVYRKSTGGKTILAGYPWFTDWGRDTLIALTGLTISTKRFEDAKSILKTFAIYVKDGLLPNVFPDVGENPGYNTVDASMWFFEGVYNYYKATNDKEFLKELYPKLVEIHSRYSSSKEDIQSKDTEIIYMCDDSLIYAGNEHTQLTWMDAKVGDYVVTPRYGKAVEINALWYNANMIMSEFSSILDEKDDYLKLDKKIKKSFEKVFWNKKGKYLYDVVNENEASAKIRPNQIMALSLNFPVIEGEKAEAVFDIVADKLYTPVGLRTLAPDDEEYKGIYIGDIWNRDCAYHQGTAWTWTLGEFVGAAKKLNKEEYYIEKIIEKLKYHLEEETLGNISEIFDGDFPHTLRGCGAQAWSITEFYRVWALLHNRHNGSGTV